MLKVRKEQTLELEFAEKIFDKLYSNCLQYVASQSASIAFPELANIFLHQVHIIFINQNINFFYLVQFRVVNLFKLFDYQRNAH